ncbi:MAG: cob(I)yrinic acid a,c-diamide adenosyltransferase [Candidatus Aminicenantes bacterium]
MKRHKALKKERTAPAKKNRKGYIQIYTGKGKGKTTAALGLALRAFGHGYRAFIGQFLKGQNYGELKAVEKLSPLITIKQFGRKGFIHVTKNPDEEDIKRAKKGLNKCLEAMLSRNYKIIILDEINVAVYFNLLTEKEIHDFLDQKPDDVEIVLTGRYAPASFIKRADLVTEMKEKKHYYAKGVRARDGFER